MIRYIASILAVIMIAIAAINQASIEPHDKTTITTTNNQTELHTIAKSTNCGDLRIAYNVDHNVWRGGIKDGHEQAVEPYLELMKSILRRLARLEQQGRCGG